jgi:hypothetical protein
MWSEIAREIWHVGNRPIYVILLLGSEEEWQLYNIYARDSGLKGVDVVVECAPLPDNEIIVHMPGMTMEEIIVDPIAVEVPRQEEWQCVVTHRVSLGSELAKMNSKSLNLALVRDEFDGDTFD